jgi:hypothetical protein
MVCTNEASSLRLVEGITAWRADAALGKVIQARGLADATIWLMQPCVLDDDSVFFAWQDYPRWPGIIAPPKERIVLMKGAGQFYPHGQGVFDFTWVASNVGVHLLMKGAGQFYPHGQGVFDFTWVASNVGVHRMAYRHLLE